MRPCLFFINTLPHPCLIFQPLILLMVSKSLSLIWLLLRSTCTIRSMILSVDAQNHISHLSPMLYSFLWLSTLVNGIAIHLASKAKTNQANRQKRNYLKFTSLHRFPQEPSNHVLWNVPLRYFLYLHLLFIYTAKSLAIFIEATGIGI